MYTSFWLGLLLMSVTGVCAEPQNFPAHTLTLAASCAVCHGTNGNSATGLLSLAGMDESVFIAKLQAYRNGSQASTVMHHHAKGLTEAEITALAGYFSVQQHQAIVEPQAQTLELQHE
ncbi:cytochrome c [Methylobacillus caricis]|uniref:c-type cytochrome n=1 Tax=Methylobacillus caricis TaxID=1971611 RepID=UPI001CFF9396|nr:c-type cytochrome [Methylobacillus caricis]MCB5187016.1 cytochrome c [Methylobacillus caricis]